MKTILTAASVLVLALFFILFMMAIYWGSPWHTAATFAGMFVSIMLLIRWLRRLT